MTGNHPTPGPWSTPEKRPLSFNAVVALSVVCNSLLAALFFGGAGWAVIVHGSSPWWLLTAIVFYLLSMHSVRREGSQ